MHESGTKPRGLSLLGPRKSPLSPEWRSLDLLTLPPPPPDWIHHWTGAPLNLRRTCGKMLSNGCGDSHYGGEQEGIREAGGRARK